MDKVSKKKKNHVWWCAQSCQQQPNLLGDKFMSAIYHTTSQHSWITLDYFNACAHPPLSREREKRTKWLKPDSPAHQPLKKAILDKQILNAIGQLSEFLHTGDLESYHSLITKYVPKRQRFPCIYEGMLLTTMLAVFDHNFNTDRNLATDKAGNVRQKICLSKRTKK